jgi:hypothetical protein
MTRPSLLQTLKQLRLSGLAQSLEVRLAEAAGNRLDHGEFLELILQDELNVRSSVTVPPTPCLMAEPGGGGPTVVSRDGHQASPAARPSGRVSTRRAGSFAILPRRICR